jgi:hypothetical protein
LLLSLPFLLLLLLLLLIIIIIIVVFSSSFSSLSPSSYLHNVLDVRGPPWHLVGVFRRPLASVGCLVGLVILASASLKHTRQECCLETLTLTFISPNKNVTMNKSKYMYKRSWGGQWVNTYQCRNLRITRRHHHWHHHHKQQQ